MSPHDAGDGPSISRPEPLTRSTRPGDQPDRAEYLRDVTTAELMGLALALGAPPAAFLAVETPVAIGGHALSVATVNDWVKGRYALGLNPDGSGLTKIVAVGQAVERRGAE